MILCVTKPTVAKPIVTMLPNNLNKTKQCFFLSLPKKFKYAAVSICCSNAYANEIGIENAQQKNIKWMHNINSFITFIQHLHL